MVYIIIDHHCSFISYIIAISIFIKYSHNLPNFRLIIIENELHQSLIDIKPWCGISTLNHFKLSQIPFHFFLNYVLPIGKLSIQPLPKNLNHPVNELMTTVIDQHNPVGLIYHPSELMNNIRLELFKSGKVSFMSYNSNFHKQQIYNNFKGINNSIIYNSNLIQVNCLNGQLPNSILWLPRIQFNQDVNYIINESNIILDSTPVRNNPIINIDLNYALKQGDIVLSAINNFIGTSIPLGNKL
ncbi:hypothetical protein K6H10_002435 [Candida tropicalis]